MKSIHSRVCTPCANQSIHLEGRMHKFMLCLVLFFSCFESELWAGDAHPTISLKETKRIKKNSTCHYCRIGSRPNTAIITACPNDECQQSFCSNCLKRHMKMTVEDFLNNATKGCLRCQKNCCCSYELCDLDHKHCLAYKRTKQRATFAKEPKYQTRRKARKTTAGENGFLFIECTKNYVSLYTRTKKNPSPTPDPHSEKTKPKRSIDRNGIIKIDELLNSDTEEDFSANSLDKTRQ